MGGGGLFFKIKYTKLITLRILVFKFFIYIILCHISVLDKSCLWDIFILIKHIKYLYTAEGDVTTPVTPHPGYASDGNILKNTCNITKSNRKMQNKNY